MLRTRALATTVALLIAAAMAAGGASGASPNGTTEHGSFSAVGASFMCGTTELTGTAGSVSFVIHESTDGSGTFHITGTFTPQGVTLIDQDGNLYSLSGASWFGGKPDTGPITSIDKLQIHNATGGLFGSVNVVEHFSTNGNMFEFDFGNCTDNNG